jgi:hypothetical protein
MSNNNLKPISYDYLKEISYDTDEEYQTELNKILKIYDCDHITILDELFMATSNDTLLMDLYTSAAEKQLLQSDPEMGLILLFSYDCFYDFHALLKLYFTAVVGSSDETKEACLWNENNENYKKLKEIFSKSD